jgi:protein DGCR14
MNKQVLDEDEYINRLESIIQRDFFPDLNRIRTQIERMKHTGVQIVPNNVNEPSTPTLSISTEATNDSLLDDRLNDFLHQYTSEDNASFSVLLDKMKKKHKQYMDYMYQVNNEQKLLAIESKPTLAIENKKPTSNKALVLAQDEKIQFAKESHPHENSLYFYASADSVNRKSDINELQAPKETTYSRTRFSSKVLEKIENPAPQPIKDNSRNMVWGLDQLSNNMLQSNAAPKKKEERYNLDQLLATPSAQLLSKKRDEPDTPQIGGYKMVRTPLPQENDDLVMTWGTMEGTPLPLDTIGHNPFKVSETSKREALSHKLAKKAAKDLKKRQALTTPRGTPGGMTPSTPGTPGANRLTSLSPAAQKLAAKLGNTPSIFGSSPFVKQGATPTPFKAPTTKKRSIPDSTEQAKKKKKI